MTDKEKVLAHYLLLEYAELLGNMTCNDWEFPKSWSKEEKIEFVKAYHEWNGSPEDFDVINLNLPDFAVVKFLAYKIKNC